jgi:hypothetical protein
MDNIQNCDSYIKLLIMCKLFKTCGACNLLGHVHKCIKCRKHYERVLNGSIYGYTWPHY